MPRPTAPLLALAVIALGARAARADDPPPPRSPWIDEAPPSPPSVPAPPVEEPAPRPEATWRIVAAAMLGMRADQGGLISSGYRFVGVLGLRTRPVDLTFALDHQLGDDNRILGTTNAAARYSEWVGSARVGRAFPIGPDFWVQVSGGIARVNTRVTRIETMSSEQTATLGFDALATIVWRSGFIASTLVFGATAIPSDVDLVIEGRTYRLPQRIEPWFGLGVALIFF